MPIDSTTAGTPGWWLARLMGKLGEKQADHDLLDSYYQGTNGVPVLASKTVRQAYRRLMSMSRTNFGELVVEAGEGLQNTDGLLVRLVRKGLGQITSGGQSGEDTEDPGAQ